MKKYKLDKGILIAIEGIDGAGKTTQTFRLRDHFRRSGFDVETFKEPTNGKYGQEIRKLAVNGRQNVTPRYELELFLNDRIEDCKNNIKPSLEQKKVVFIDRYYFSNIAYQGALGIDIDYIREKNEAIAVIPDLVLILDLAVKIGLSRIENFRNEKHNYFEKEDYLEKVRSIFLEMKSPFIQVIDASNDEDTVFNNMKNIIQDIIFPFISPIDSQFDLFKKKSQEGILFSRN